MNKSIKLNGQALQVHCDHISHDTKLHIESLRNHFLTVPAIELTQYWRGNVEDRFRPGYVNIGRVDDRLVVFAEMVDEDIYNPATKFWRAPRNLTQAL